MSHLPTLISDLALILVCAGLMTLLFKKLKQPLVLGYVVAGFLASPHMPYTPSVMDTANIQTWADLGVVFLLFALGLDFSLKKIAKVGGAAIIAACTIIFCMILLGMTMAASHNFEGTEMMESILKLMFFLVLWFVVGIYLIPGLLKRCRRLMSDETLLIVALGLCFAMVVIAAKTGFSPAFGAFIMGSILAETAEAESIERLVAPVKDLFGAVFFVSVGMMVDPAMIVEYAVPILVITLAVIGGQAVFGTLGVLLSGQPLKTAMQCGFSLTQIGEFAFIIASLGVSLGVTSNFLYPIVVAVSVITTFLTPYMIRVAGPASTFVDSHLPAKWRAWLERYATAGSPTMNHESLWKKLIVALVRITVVYSVVSIAVVALAFRLLVPLLREALPGIWGQLASAVIIILCLAPFLRAIMIKKNHSVEFTTLWKESRANRAPLVATVVLRILVAAGFVIFVIGGLFKMSVGLVLGVAVLLLVLMIMSRQLKRQSILIERTFFQNLRYRDMRAEYLGEKKPEYAGRLLSRDLHLADYVLPSEARWAGHTLGELNFGSKYGVHVVSVLRGRRRFNIPGASLRLFPQDKLQVIGTDEDLAVFSRDMEQVSALETDVVEKSEMILRQFSVDAGSPFLGKTLREAGIREKYRCLIAGVDRGDGTLHAPVPAEPFLEGDVVWIVGESNDVRRLVKSEEKEE